MIRINKNSWTDVNGRDVTAYMKSKAMAEKSAWDFVNGQTGSDKLELVAINPGPIYGPTLTGNLDGEAMAFFKKMITGKVPMMPQAASVMSDVRDVAKIHVLAMENPEATGKRFIVTTEKAYPIQEIGKILKADGYKKVSTMLAPNFLVKFMANFNDEMKGMLPFVANTIEADISDTMRTFSWKPIAFEKTVLDTARSVKAILDNNA